MKIYPGKHSIYNVDSIDKTRDIALGYLDSEFLEEKISISIDNEFSVDKTKEVLPYESFKTNEISLFNKDGKLIDKIEQANMLVKQVAGSYSYFPKASTVFEPLTFNYKVLAKKQMKYLTSRKYNINVACEDKNLASTLIQYFSNSNDRKICPSNIKFNNSDKKLESLLNTSVEDIDFIFLNSNDGINYTDGNEILINDYIDNNVIPWIITDAIPDSYIDENKDYGDIRFSISNPSVTNAEPFYTKEYFKIPNTTTHTVSSGEEFNVKYHDIFKNYNGMSPIIIKEIKDKGFVVYANSEFMARLSELTTVFYEVLMYVYLRGYIATQTITEWITDEMPNYIVQNGRLTQKEKFTSHMELHKLLGLRDGDAIPINVDIELPKIAYYTGMSSNYLVFKKTKQAETSDPIKNTNQISIFTERKNVMFYDDFLYSIKENIKDKINYSISGDFLYVTVKDFKNTDYDTGSYKTTTVNFKLDESLLSQEIKLVWNKNLKTVELLSTLREETILMATIEVLREKKGSKLYDMRQRGGGLPEESANEYDCLDIGNVLGRPYRKGGTLITTINVPKKYEHMSEDIYNKAYEEIRKQMIAEDYLILKLEFI